MKKKYNAFKMWGSWVGAILGWLSIMFFPIGYSNFFYVTIWQRLLHIPPFHGAATVLIIVIGFLLGYGIHSLVRAIRK